MSLVMSGAKTISAPYPRVASTFDWGAVCGIATVTGTPAVRAAKAIAWAALPALMVTIPRWRCSFESLEMALTAPRGLNDPFRQRPTRKERSAMENRPDDLAGTLDIGERDRDGLLASLHGARSPLFRD